jgi:polyisoprenyl-phosphate glycosyltransferase
MFADLRVSTKIAILIPVYNDWLSLSTLLSRLDETLQGRTEQFYLLVVDDASEEFPPESVLNPSSLFSESKLLRLRCNLGHQRAIAVGLAWLCHNAIPDAVVVMDGDGEDKPEDVPRLLNKFMQDGETQAVFAERTRRSEGFGFTFFYKLYQLAHRLLTGLPVNIGNFSILPGEYLRSLVVSSQLWSHYAATVVNQRLGLTTIPTRRGYRYQGRSKMNFVSLVRHGLSALAVHSELVAVRLLVATGSFCVIGMTLLAVCSAIRLFTSLAVPGWATYVSAFIVVIMLQILSITFLFTVQAFSGLNSMAFLPTRDYAYFVSYITPLPLTAESPTNRRRNHSSTHV